MLKVVLYLLMAIVIMGGTYVVVTVDSTLCAYGVGVGALMAALLLGACIHDHGRTYR